MCSADMLCVSRGQEGLLSLQFLIAQLLRARGQEVPRYVTQQPKVLTTACKPLSLILTSEWGWLKNKSREGHLNSL